MHATFAFAMTIEIAASDSAVLESGDFDVFVMMGIKDCCYVCLEKEMVCGIEV